MDSDFGEKMDKIMDLLVRKLDCSNGDAQSVFEAYEMYHEIDWDLSAEEIVNLVCA